MNTKTKVNTTSWRTAFWSAAALALALGANASADVWKFGVMSDTQWTTTDPAEENPNSVSVSIINQLNTQFINAGVKFVIQVGDLTDNGALVALDSRTNAAKALYNASIGFFPLRGNHEGSQGAAARFKTDFPQTQGGGPYLFGANNFISASISGLVGLSYSFDYQNARFVLLDQFTRTDGTGSDNNNAMVDQVPWVGPTLANRAAGTHAFVFSHKIHCYRGWPARDG